MKNILQNNLPVLFFLMIGIMLLYANTFHSPFTFDDSQILENYYIARDNMALESLKLVPAISPNRWRILPNLSFALNYYLGGSNVFGYHLVNIIIHIAATFVFFLLAKTTLQLPGLANRFQRGTEIAFAAALLWAVHPLQTNAVTYIVQRMTSMAALFFLLALFCYIKGRIHDIAIKKILLFGASALFGVMAMFSKENSGMLPIIILGYELFFLRQTQNTVQNRKKILLLYCSALILFAFICLFMLGTNPLGSILGGYGDREFTLGQRLLTETRIIFHYLSLLILPLPSRLNLAYDYQLSTSLLVPPQTLLAIAGIAGLLFLIHFLYKRDRLTSFAIFWFLANLTVESTFIPLELIFEHRMYMPSMFLILTAIAWYYRIIPGKAKAARLTLVALIAILALFTWQRNSAWKNEITLWSDVVQKSPGSIRGYVNLGNAYGKIGKHPEADTYLLKAIELGPADGHAFESLGTSFEKQQRYEDAISMYNRALVLKGTDIAKLHSNLSIAYLRVGNYKAAIEHASKSNDLNPFRYNPYATLGTAYFKSKAYKQAEETFLRAIQLFPAKGDLYVGLASVYENQHRLPEALRILDTALEKKEVNLANAYNSLGIVHWRLQNYRQSVAAARKALEHNEKLLDAYLTLGITLEDMGQPHEAFQQFRKGWEQGLNMVDIYNDWAINFIKMNDLDKAVLYLQEAIKLDPNDPDSYFNLSTAYHLKNMPDEAEKYRQLYQQNKKKLKNKIVSPELHN